ncbi:EAL domain-containing protein [Klebsiella michiganensis]|uniref:EAL domain-containing protein n=1 Tax=Klebsiella/Raoultella group TaxID=2890311 RepID=UPI001035224D|nr:MULTISPECIES: EAL domain-containing protein [Klebsiella/Raoultella group]MCF6692620.1 EAL domain-containing protein [Raoultella terrigena]MEB4603270.1 EAL domain-containing protein [Raoultella ornithinolytica]MEB7602154.1 EAL domain-containing protein [Raoultella terrigena]MEB8081402.1 EAL domain-containing protein [Klebsiella michiganensis]
MVTENQVVSIYKNDIYYDFICEPIYRICDESLLAVELLTHFYDERGLRKKNTAEIFESMSFRQKDFFFYCQIKKIEQQSRWFYKEKVLCSINIDNDIADILSSNKQTSALLSTLPFVRLEVNENYRGLGCNENIDLLQPLLKYSKGVWLDDFGAGKSTLSSINGIGFEVIKIDKEFFWQESEKETFPSVIQAIHRSCNRIVIEGIAQREMLQTLVGLNIWGVQGYAFPSVSLNDVERLAN